MLTTIDFRNVSEEDVNFLTKLKKPVFTKKLKSDQEERSLARNATPSSPALHDLGSPVTPQAMSPGHKPHFHKFNRAVSAPVSSATLQSLQSVQPRVPSPSDQDMPSKESIGNAHVLPPASMSLMNELSLGGNRSTSALEDNDDILSSYVYEVEEGAAGSFATSRSLKNDGGVHSPHHVPSSSLDSRQNRSVRPESVSHLLAPLHIGQNSAPEAAQLNTSTSASAPSQARKVHILPNLPAGVSLKQLRENRSPRFALFPRSASFSNLGGETSRGGYSNDHSANVNLASPSRAPQNITDFFLPVDNVWSEPTQTPLASPVPSSFVSVESPTSPLSPSSVSYPEYGNLATSVSTNAIEHHSHGVWQQHDLQQRKQTDLHRTTSHREDAASDTRSLSSATSSFKGLRHSRSMSSLTRAGTMFQRRPSLPNRTDSNAGSIGTEGVVELNNAQFEFVHPNGTDSGGDSPHSNADSSQSGGSARLVTRPSASAKERVKSIYVFDLPEQSPAPSHRVDKYGFMHSQHTSLPIHELDMPDSNNASALQAYRTRELKVSLMTKHLLTTLLTVRASQWVSIMSSMAARNARSSNKVRKLVNHGIPDSVRGKAWVT